MDKRELKSKATKVIKQVVTSTKHIVGNAGTAIVGEILKKADMNPFNKIPSELLHPGNVYPLSDVVKSQIATMCAGDPSFEGNRILRQDEEFFTSALGMPAIPSPERTRQRLDP